MAPQDHFPVFHGRKRAFKYKVERYGVSIFHSVKTTYFFHTPSPAMHYLLVLEVLCTNIYPGANTGKNTVGVSTLVESCTGLLQIVPFIKQQRRNVLSLSNFMIPSISRLT